MPLKDALLSRLPLAIATLAASRSGGPQSVAALMQGRDRARQLASQQALQEQALAQRAADQARQQEMEEARLALSVNADQRADEAAYFQRFGHAREAAQGIAEQAAASSPTLNDAMTTTAQQIGPLTAHYGLPQGALSQVLVGMSGRAQAALQREAQAILSKVDPHLDQAAATVRPPPGLLLNRMAALGMGTTATLDQLREIAQLPRVSGPAGARDVSPEREYLNLMQEGRRSEAKTVLDARRQYSDAGRSQDDGVSRQLREMQLSAAQDKMSVASETRDRQRAALAETAQITLNAVDRLLQPDSRAPGSFVLTPAAEAITGFSRQAGPGLKRFIGGSAEADAEASLSRLGSRLIVDLIAEMKSQSHTGATGFGQLSDQERLVLREAAGRLSTTQSPAGLLDALLETRRLTEKSLMQSAVNGGTAAEMPGRGVVTVTAPDGQAYPFPTQAAADAFKREAGIP